MRQRLSVKHAERQERGLRALLYVRCSTDLQELDRQKTELLAECERRGIIEYLVVEDKGVSGAVKDRPGLSNALDLLRRGDFTLLMVTDLDRLARSTAHVLELAEAAQRQGWDFIALGGRVVFDTSTPQGKLLLTMLAGFGEFERDMIRSRIKSAFDHKRASGEEGYIAPTTESRVEALFREQLSMRGIADRLNQDGVQTAKGGVWHASTVRRVLVRRGLARELVKRGA